MRSGSCSPLEIDCPSTMLCLSIIDYFTRYSVARYFESAVKDFKFHNYASKVEYMFQCATSPEYSAVDATISESYYTKEQTRRVVIATKAKYNPVTQKRAEIETFLEKHQCSDYWRLA